ncbi:hypothetical protein HK104_009095 [Borealophlyctis nickersoniae]|nr:hypothetical protein HK104_009095 [Borealophlyctis nickersoniae]
MSLEEVGGRELHTLHRDLSRLVGDDHGAGKDGDTMGGTESREFHFDSLEDLEGDENALLQRREDDDGISDTFSDGSISFDFGNIHAFPLASTLSKSDTNLPENVSLWSGLALIIGMSIGSGIFASPGPVFAHAGSVGAALGVWIMAGLLSLSGAVSYAELGAMIPESGGEHPYLMKAYGSLPAFLFSWTGTTVTRPGSVAIITVIFAEYVCRLIYFQHPVGASPAWLVKLIATICIVGLTAVNCLSTRLGTAVQDLFTILKLASLLVIGAFGLKVILSGQSRSHNYDHSLFAGSSRNAGDYTLALYSALWAYDGWNTLNLVTGELKNSAKNLPRAIVAGPSIVILSYVLANVAYYAVLPAAVVGKSTTIAMDFGREMFGSVGSIIIPLVVIGATFGAANASIFGGARVIAKEAPKAALGAAMFMLSGVPLWVLVVMKGVTWEAIGEYLKTGGLIMLGICITICPSMGDRPRVDWARWTGWERVTGWWRSRSYHKQRSQESDSDLAMDETGVGFAP